MPTEVWTAADLDNVRNDLTGSYIQMADIDMGGVAFVPISVIGGDAFTGVYDGNNKKISNLTIEETFASSTTYTALFRWASGPTTEIKNLTLENCFIQGGVFVAGIVGHIEGGYLSNIIVQGEIKGYRNVGGIASEVYTINNYPDPTWNTNQVSFVGCRMEGIIRGPGYFSVHGTPRGRFGGIVAAGWGSLIAHRCSAIVEFIDAGVDVGGIGGYWNGHDDSWTSEQWAAHEEGVGPGPCHATESYAKIVVHTVDRGGEEYPGQWLHRAGGFLGDADDVYTKDCYSRMEIIKDGSPSADPLNGEGVSGFAGQSDYFTAEHCYSAAVFDPEIWSPDLSSHFTSHNDRGVLTNCYADTTISNVIEECLYSSGIELRATGEMVYPYTDKHVSGTYVDWDFEEAHITDLTDFDFVFGEPWKHDPDFMLNDGYPQFEPTISPVDPSLTKATDCTTPAPPIFSISLNYGNFNSMVIEREEAKITQYRFINPETDLTLRTKWRYLTPKLEHNVECGFEVRGILIRYKVRGQKPRVRPED